MLSMLEEILRLNKKPDDSNIKSEDAKKEEAMEIKARGNRAYKRKNFSLAIEEYFRALRCDPSNLGVLGNISAICFEEKRFFECKRICQIILKEEEGEQQPELEGEQEILATNEEDIFRAKIRKRMESADLIHKKQLESIQHAVEPLTEPMYIVGSLPGKGQGLIAVCPIRPGDLIVSERALIFLPSSTNAALETVRQYRQLGKDQKKTYLSLCNSFDEDGGRNPEEGRARHNDEEDNVIGIYQSNACHIEAGNIGGQSRNDASSRTGIFPIMSKINHSCVPNSNFFWREEERELAVVAVEAIETGEEITDTYLPDRSVLTLKERQSNLWGTHKFKCRCRELCGEEDISMREAADAFVGRVKAIREQINTEARTKIVRRVDCKLNEPYYSALQDLNSLLLSNPGKIHFLFRLLVNQLIFFSCLLTARNEEALEAARETAELYGIATGGLEHDLSNRWRQIPREFHRYIQDKKELSYMIQSWEAEL